MLISSYALLLCFDIHDKLIVCNLVPVLWSFDESVAIWEYGCTIFGVAHLLLGENEEREVDGLMLLMECAVLFKGVDCRNTSNCNKVSCLLGLPVLKRTRMLMICVCQNL